tara:strand:- start:563 stop:1279 length:717 start_codon:yes stop_codon:yes gene_type:complete
MKTITTIMMLYLTALIGSVFANDIYIDQVGDTLDLDIVQDGTNNVIGTSTTDVTLEGANMTFSITQTGNSNTIAAVIKGTTYTGTWAFTGNSNTVDLKCSSNSTGNCDTVTLNITATGDSNTFDFDIGESASADNSTVSFTLTGDKTDVVAAIDGTSAAATVTNDNSSSLATTSTDSDEGNVITLDMDGNGDSQGHTVILDIVGGGSTYNVTQSGVNDAIVDADFDGDSQDVDITQSD